jgi:hypothetical protein
MEIHTMVTGLMDKEMEKEYLIGLRKVFIMEIGTKEICMVKGLIYQNLEIFKGENGPIMYIFLMIDIKKIIT